ncbi:DUF1611 domain-containing protein [Erythrobacter sp. NE805]|uniref:DUF1611 domain-containing protein n=1 Tax=Erythrobacter sp. NE805 TaxID=3389875 RepID=UPI00396AF7CD
MIPKPYLMFMGRESVLRSAKTALGIRDWAPQDCVAQWRLGAEAIDLGLAEMRPRAAREAGARAMVLGIAPVGGALPEEWIAPILEAMEAGLDIVSGLHARLTDVPAIAEAAQRLGRTLHEVRHPRRPFPIATGHRRPGKRLLTVGTDCALGKKYTSLAIAREMRSRGIDADFRATGQTGIMIAGDGIAMDAVVSDFIAGAAETLSPAAHPDHWDVIEGQGAILHPSFAGVTLGLLHGSQPDVLILCHDPSRSAIASTPGFPFRSLGETRDLYLSLARLTNPQVRFAGIALNTSSLGEADARALAAALEASEGLPVFDPLRFGIAAAVDAVLA